MVSFETSAGKKINIVPASNTSLLKIQFVPGGELPPQLAGLFSSEKEASQAIRIYLAKDSKKEAPTKV